MKELPPEGLDVNYYAGFLDGWRIADGCGERLDSQNAKALDWAEKYAPMCGLVVTGRSQSKIMDTNIGRQSAPLGCVYLRPSSEVTWKVTKIEPMKGLHPVYCAVVPKIKAFTLSGGIYTGNCVVVLLAQLSDEGIIRYSKALKEHSSNMWSWIYNSEARESHLINIRQDKARNQKSFDFVLQENFECMRIGDFEGEELPSSSQPKKKKATWGKKPASKRDKAENEPDNKVKKAKVKRDDYYEL